MSDPFQIRSAEPLFADIARNMHSIQRAAQERPKIEERERDDARTRILKTALKQFAMKGFHGVSTTEIAKDSAVTQPLIHYHFKTKEALWKAAVEQAFSWLKEDLSGLLKKPELRQRALFVAFVKTLVAFAAKHPEVGQFLLREGMQKDSERLTWMTEQLLQPAFDILSVYYQQGVGEGWLQPLPFAQLSVMLTAMSTHFFAVAPMINQLYGVDAQDPEQITKLTDLVVQFVEKVIIKAA